MFARVEQADKDNLFLASSPLADQAFRVGKLSLGYAYSLRATGHVVIDLGGLFSVYSLPNGPEADLWRGAAQLHAVHARPLRLKAGGGGDGHGIIARRFNLNRQSRPCAGTE